MTPNPKILAHANWKRLPTPIRGALVILWMPLREYPTAAEAQLLENPAPAADYWRAHVPAHPYFNPDVECFAVIMVNSRRRVKGHYLVSLGTLDTLLTHPREVFRPAIIGAAAAIILSRNHSSGDPTPSKADIKVTRDLIPAGQLLKIEILAQETLAEAAATFYDVGELRAQLGGSAE
jgi:DNA repair protein RadC